jgi:hypothetical protein
MDLDALREEIHCLLTAMDAITAHRDPTPEEIAYYPEALKAARTKLYEAELKGKTMELPDGTKYTWN